MTTAGERLGMFGGAFDPPHNAHVVLAQAALARLDLAELRVFPTGQAWHKDRSRKRRFTSDRLERSRMGLMRRERFLIRAVPIIVDRSQIELLPHGYLNGDKPAGLQCRALGRRCQGKRPN